MGIYMWRGERRPPLRECGVYMYIYRPLDDARPGELDGEGWGSDDDWAYRGYDFCFSPLPVTSSLEGGREECEPTLARSSPPCPPGSTAGPYSAPRSLDEARPGELDG
jgi:hypothetical protein